MVRSPWPLPNKAFLCSACLLGRPLSLRRSSVPWRRVTVSCSACRRFSKPAPCLLQLPTSLVRPFALVVSGSGRPWRSRPPHTGLRGLAACRACPDSQRKPPGSFLTLQGCPAPGPCPDPSCCCSCARPGSLDCKPSGRVRGIVIFFKHRK